MPVSLVFLSWSLMMMKGLPYSSNASVPNADMMGDSYDTKYVSNKDYLLGFSDEIQERGLATSRTGLPATSGRLHGRGRRNHVAHSGSSFPFFFYT